MLAALQVYGPTLNYSLLMQDKFQSIENKVGGCTPVSDGSKRVSSTSHKMTSSLEQHHSLIKNDSINGEPSQVSSSQITALTFR